MMAYIHYSIGSHYILAQKVRDNKLIVNRGVLSVTHAMRMKSNDESIV